MHTSSLAVALGLALANAEYETCRMPTAEWVGVDQAHGTSQATSVAYLGDNVYVAGYMMGDFSFSSVHATNGAQGETDDHTQVVVQHETESFAAGRYSDPASSQHGMDGFVLKVGADGVPEWLYAVDTLPADGKYEDSVNGASGGFITFNGLAAFPDGQHVVATAQFRGNLTFPLNGDKTQVLTNWKNRNYDVAVVKIDSTTQKAAWVRGIHDADPDTNKYNRKVAISAAGHVLVSGDNRVSRVYFGTLNKIDGATGEPVWSKTFAELTNLYGAAAHGEDIIFGGEVEGVDVDPIGTGPVTSAEGGEDNSAFVARLDADGEGKWFRQLGGGRTYDIKVVGDHVYATGWLTSNDGWTLSGACALSGTRGGFLIKLDAATGACVWAKDIAFMRALAANDASVYTVAYDNEAVNMDDTHVLRSRGNEDDMFVAKYSADTGLGEFATSFGGTGDDRVYSVALDPNGVPVIAGRTSSDAIQIGDVSVKNLQHHRAEADPGAEDALNAGKNALLIVKFSADGKQPDCLTTCSTNDQNVRTATVKDGTCFVDDVCYANNEASMFKECFRCEAANSKNSFAGPITTNHCYFDEICHRRGAYAPAYKRYNEPSVCEWCDPDVRTDGWSLRTGYFADIDFASIENGGHGGGTQDSVFGMLFQMGSNGCQLLPDLSLTDPPPAALADALSHYKTSEQLLASGFADALAALENSAAKDHKTAEHVRHALGKTGMYADSSNDARKAAAHAFFAETLAFHRAREVLADPSQQDNWEHAWGYYHGDEDACTKGLDVCHNTPAAHADTIAPDFGTALYYGHSVARVKVQQALFLGHQYAKNGGDLELLSHFQRDAVAHMMLPFYQSIIANAHIMDTGSAAERHVAQHKAFAHWKAIEDDMLAVNPEEARSVAAVLDPSQNPSPSGGFNFCKTRLLLEANLPTGSRLQYTDGAAALIDESRDPVHMTLVDLGELTAAGVQAPCFYPSPSPHPPPSPPSPPPPSPPPPDEGLSSGQIAGITVGAAVGGLLLISAIAFVFYSRNKKAKGVPIFVCLEGEQKKPYTPPTTTGTTQKEAGTEGGDKPATAAV